ncbi:MAG: VCBS repeat-containing protein, partial [Myxococcaceae bacterium]
MRPLTHVLALTAVALAGCLDRADLSLNVPGPPQPVPEFDCERITEPLAVRATPERARIRSRVLLTATGGSGHYRFGLEPGGSGGELQGDALVTGPTPSTDTAFVEDTSCGGKATTVVEVLAAFSVAPSRATLKPGASFKIAVDGTVGTPVFALLQAGSSGTLTADGHYTAGSTNGLDLVQVRDSATGDEALLQYEVKSSARFRASPDRLALPSGSSIPLRAAEGTGHVVWTKLSGYGTVEGSRFLTDAMASGVTELQAVDLFTGETAGLSIRILDDLERDSVPHGRLGDVAVIVTGNFDGDGIEDIAVGLPTSNLARPTGGAVFIFKGSPEGFGESPTWTLAGPSDTAQFGVALAAGDLDGNGTDELAIGAPGADITIADSGAVYLYRFDAAGPQLLRTPLTNPGRGRFGSSLELADMDSDGDLDLVVGSPAADLAPTATVRNRGIVDVFLLSRNAPVPDLPSIRLGGMDLNADGGVISRSNTAIGRGVLALDLNEDKTIDLAALGFINEVLADGGLVTRPAIQVHLSRGGKAPFRPVPDAYVLPRNPSDSSEGTYRLAGIPGGSGLPPLLMVSIDAADSPDLSADGGYRSGTNAGGALLFDLSDISPAEPPSQSPAKLDRTDAYARIYGESASISAGRSFEVMDVDGEPGPELLLGAPYASPVGADDAGVRLAGKVLVYPLSGLAPGAVLNKPLTSLPGGAPTDVLGVGLRRWSRPGGGHGLLAVAGRASTVWGNFTGRLDAYVPNADAFSSWTTRTRSGLPATAALEQFGVSVAAARSRDGSAAAFIGAPGVSGRGSLNDG